MPVKPPEIPTSRLYTLPAFAEVWTGEKELHTLDFGSYLDQRHVDFAKAVKSQWNCGTA